MPSISVGDTTLHYRFDGPEDAPVILLSNSLASNLGMWDDQIPTLLEAGYRVLRYDSRGHGQSGVTAGPYSIEQLADDAVGLLDALGLGRVSFMGCSKGGMVGQMLGTRHHQRIDRLVLCATAAYAGGPETWAPRIAAVRDGGMAAVVDGTIERWFTAPGRARMPAEVERIRQMILSTPPAGFIACGEAIAAMDQRESIRAIDRPTLVVVGEHDPGTPVSAAELIHDRISGSELVVLRDCAHFANVEQAAAFNAAIAGFLGR
ncbi:MAG: 3-oxoadipate enol-lactonase [Ectothiorhodospiraceae bacterium]|nr:3-oxoadipate enol-lactonase [Ectothiorhodospiraceae bacterium]